MDLRYHWMIRIVAAFAFGYADVDLDPHSCIQSCCPQFSA
jgi:hypothetical protein